jgi:hypothetical protein
MRRVLAMCGPDLDERLAQRIGIDIVATEAKVNFKGCASELKEEVSVYHPLIARVLQEP